MRSTNKIGIAILFSALLISQNSFSASCYEQSPNYTLLGDKYFDLNDSKPLTASDKESIKAALEKMVGDWKGKGSLFQCIGPESELITENAQFTLSAKISTNSASELHVDVEKYLLASKTKSFDHLFLFGDTNSYRSVLITTNKIVLIEVFRHERIKTKTPERTENDSNSSPITALDESPSQKTAKVNIKKIFDKKTHVKASKQETLEDEPQKGSVKKKQERHNPFYEVMHTIEYNKTHFNYNFRRYINGSLAVEETWQLVRN